MFTYDWTNFPFTNVSLFSFSSFNACSAAASGCGLRSSVPRMSRSSVTDTESGRKTKCVGTGFDGSSDL